MKKILIFFINIYQKHISSLISKEGIHCKFYPTCSEYTKQAILKYGSFKGMKLGLKRILKCRPHGIYGYQPLE